MAKTSLQVRFTDEKYCTRNDVAKSLGTSLIDPFWNEILAYRKQFDKILNISDFTKTKLHLCLCKSITSKIAETSECYYNYKESFYALEKGSMDYNRITSRLSRNCLSELAKANGLTLDHVSCDNILNHQNIDFQFSSLERYLNAFKLLTNETRNEIDEEFLASIYGEVTGNQEIMEFYRESELQGNQSKIIIGREYTGAPVGMIEDLMNELFSFIHRNDLPLFVKLSIVAYVINAVKPFAQYNTEIACLIMKALVVNEIGEAGLYLPFESLFAEQQLLISSLYKEVQRTKDITYVVNQYLDLLHQCIEKSTNEIIQHAVDEIQQERAETVKQVLAENNVPVSEEKPVETKPTYVRPVAPAPKKEEPRLTRVTETVSEAISEKDLKAFEAELLETDPTLRKGQAHFYARHREPGHFYTIEQYRKAEGCVYETARTSMDALAERGYYRREKVNNKKFVYTPIFK